MNKTLLKNNDSEEHIFTNQLLMQITQGNRNRATIQTGRHLNCEGTIQITHTMNIRLSNIQVFLKPTVEGEQL